MAQWIKSKNNKPGVGRVWRSNPHGSTLFTEKISQNFNPFQLFFDVSIQGQFDDFSADFQRQLFAFQGQKYPKKSLTFSTLF